MKNVFIALILLVSTSSAFAGEMICEINGEIKKISGCYVKPKGISCIQSGLWNSAVIYTFFDRQADGTYKVEEVVSTNPTDPMKRQDVSSPTVTGVKCKVKK